MFLKRAMKVEEVFTPRSPTVNPAMYIERKRQEEALARAIKGTQNIIIHGESGCGKSWLLKKTLGDLNIAYFTVNMANAARLDSVNAAFADRFNSLAKKIKIGEDISMEGGISAGFAKADAGVVEKIEYLEKEPFENCVELLRRTSGDQKAFIVVENLESILSDSKKVSDIASLITLLDDEHYAQYKVRIILIGVPDDIQRYFANTQYAQTVANRLVEIPEVERLSRDDAETLLRRGFVDLLKLKIARGVALDELAWYADFIPQHVHEVGLEIGHLAEDGEVTQEIITNALANWEQSSLTGDMAIIDQKMNARQTKAGRRNQTIYVIGNMDGVDFRATDVERKLREVFPQSTADIALNPAQTLAELSEDPNPIIRRNPKGDAFRFVSPKYRICIRSRLRIGDDERVVRV